MSPLFIIDNKNIVFIQIYYKPTTLVYRAYCVQKVKGLYKNMHYKKTTDKLIRASRLWSLLWNELNMYYFILKAKLLQINYSLLLHKYVTWSQIWCERSCESPSFSLFLTALVYLFLMSLILSLHFKNKVLAFLERFSLCSFVTLEEKGKHNYQIINY